MESDRGYDENVWAVLCQDLGLAGLHIDEKIGGAGFGAVELAIVMEEFGRCLFCAPFFASTVLCSTAISKFGSDNYSRQLLTDLIDGAKIGTLATSEEDGHFEPTTLNTRAVKNTDDYSITGSKRFVLDGMIADVIIVLANSEDGVGLFSVNANALGLSRSAMQSMDPTRKLAKISFTNTPAQRLSSSGEIDLTEIYNLALVALANEMVGGAQTLLDTALAYTKMRVQFGRTIGSFQAIKHRLADLLLEVESAKSAAYQAAQSFADGVNVTEMASLAKACASEAYLNAAITCIQLHGGIGFTWENDTHLWFKRAKSSEVFLGSPNLHRERMLQAMGV